MCRLYLFNFLVLISLLDFAAAIRCVECSSINNTMCVDPQLYDADSRRLWLPAVDCQAGVTAQSRLAFFCRKIVQTILHKNRESELRVTRGCGWIRSPKPCYTADNEDHLETVCQCDHDMCNAGAVFKNSGIIGVLCFVAAVLR